MGPFFLYLVYFDIVYYFFKLQRKYNISCIQNQEKSMHSIQEYAYITTLVMMNKLLV